MKKIEIKIITSNLKLIKLKLFFLIKFFKLYKLKYTIKSLKTFKKRISLLRSPHIHKKTWQNYIIKYFYNNLIIFINNNIIIKLFILLKVLVANCIIKLKIKKPPLKKII